MMPISPLNHITNGYKASLRFRVWQQHHTTTFSGWLGKLRAAASRMLALPSRLPGPRRQPLNSALLGFRFCCRLLAIVESWRDRVMLAVRREATRMLDHRDERLAT